MSVLLELSRIPKASFVVPEAVKLWRESRGAGVNGAGNQENEDARLDFLNFLSEKWRRAKLFKLVTAVLKLLINWLLGRQSPKDFLFLFW